MKALMGRVERLERGDMGGLSAMVRAWLGWPLSPVEREQAERERAAPAPATDMAALPADARNWLEGR